jgi:hypothetical protein
LSASLFGGVAAFRIPFSVSETYLAAEILNVMRSETEPSDNQVKGK